MKLQPVVEITWPSGEKEKFSVKISDGTVANFGIREAGFWFYTQLDDLVIIHPQQVKMIKVSHKKFQDK